MGKGTFIATVALLIAIAGAIVAFAAYFKRRSCTLCDDLDDDMMDDTDLDYYATQVDEDDDLDLSYDTSCVSSTQDVQEDIAEEPETEDLTAENNVD